MAAPDRNVLTSVDELARRLDDPDLRILDCRHRLTDPSWGPEQYSLGHIPGALHAHIDHDLSSKPLPTTGRHPLPSPQAFQAACGRWGIGPSTRVVVYDDAGGIWAARAWWLLRDYGHADLTLLDGGITAWTQAGRPLTTDVPRITPTRFEGRPGHMPVVDAAQIMRGLPHRAHTLLDARAPERFRGETEPIDPVAGHIPTARNLPAVSLVAPDGRLLEQDELRRRFESTIGNANSPAVAYCGSGVTGTHLVLAAKRVGRDLALYPGSWSEWIRDPKRPVEKAGSSEQNPKPKTR